MEFFHRATGIPRRIAVLPGSFNPVTVAHRALARAALRHSDEVLLVLPRTFPHKEYIGAGFDARAGMLRAVAEADERTSAAASDRGLFIDIASECRQAYGDGIVLDFVCGRDAAERIAGWDYGREEAFPEMLREFGLLVAAREGEFDAPEPLRRAIRRLESPEEFDDVSASEVRRRIARGEPWEHLVPGEIVEMVRRIYAP